jgi:hypothetical protein
MSLSPEQQKMLDRLSPEQRKRLEDALNGAGAKP